MSQALRTVSQHRMQDDQFDVDLSTPRLTLGVPAAGLEHLDRVLATFDACCTVTQGESPAIPAGVEVFDVAGTRLG